MVTSRQKLGWDNDHERQRLWLKVASWYYKVLVESLKSHRTLLQFEGVVSDAHESGLTGLKVMGNIEIPLEIHYEEPLPDAQGTFHLVDEGGGDPIVDVTLLVAPEAFAELFRVFSAASGNNGGLGLQLHLKHPKGTEPDFWRAGWQREDIQISHFGFFSGAHFREAKGLGKLFS